jgi:hypothetical protein
MSKKAEQAVPTVKMERSFDGLRNVLFDQLDSLLSGTGKPEVANAVSRVASEITKSVSVQADIMRLPGTKALRSTAVPGMALLK